MLINGDPASTFSSKKIILVDNDFLGLLYKEKELLADMTNLLGQKKFAVYPFTRFEFLRDVYIPKDGLLKEKFILSPIFVHLKEKRHLEILPQIFTNSLLISKIYAHSGKSKGVSFVDLILASVVMYYSKNCLLITGNKRDFPTCIFDTVSVLNFEENENTRAISIVSFNQKKFNEARTKLMSLASEHDLSNL